ncbi:MAG: hypothetical protein WCO09_00975 [bacterium]
MHLLNFNIALIVTLVALVGLTFYKGRGVMYSLIIAFYPTAVIFSAFPYLQNVIIMKDTAFHIYLSQAFVFLVIFALVFLVTRRLSHYEGARGGVAGFIDALLLSVSVMLLVMTVTFHILPARDIYSLTADIRAFFTSDLGHFVCVLAPIVVLLTMTRRG